MTANELKEIAGKIEALNARAIELGHTIHMTGKGGCEMIALMKELDTLNGLRCDFRKEHRIGKKWDSDEAKEAYQSCPGPVDELQCYC